MKQRWHKASQTFLPFLRCGEKVSCPQTKLSLPRFCTSTKSNDGLLRRYTTTSPAKADPTLLRFEVTQSGERLDRWLTNTLLEQQGKKGAFSRSTITKLIEAGRVTIGRNICRTKKRILEPGEKVLLDARPLPNAHISIPFDLNNQIVYEDEDIVIVNKPAGVVVHPGVLKEEGTLAEALLKRIIKQKYGKKETEEETVVPRQKVDKNGNRYFLMTDEKGNKYKLYIVQRLDKDTSGILAVAKTLEARHHLTDQLKNRTLKREYLSVCFGKFKSESGVIKTLIGRDPKDRHKMKVFSDEDQLDTVKAKPSESHWEVMDYFPPKTGKVKHGDGKGWAYSFVKWKLVTGRMHQIRVHASHKGHAVLGDPVYCGKKMKQVTCVGKVPIRNQFLHAYQLGLVHPKLGTVMSFCAPLPEYFDNILEYLQSPTNKS